MFWLGLGWAVVLGGIVLMARMKWQDPEDTGAIEGVLNVSDSTAVADQKLLNDEGEEVARCFSGYLQAFSNEERGQFVVDPMRVTPLMARYFSANPMIRVDPQTLRFDVAKVIRFGGQKGIEALWSTTDGRIFDALFVKSEDGWKLDWEHFARFSDAPWALFLSGSGPDEGEFRLLARERLAEERRSDPQLSIILYAARPGFPEQAGYQSPEFLVPRESPAGKRLQEAFDLSKAGKRPLASQLPVKNPDEMIRIRARIRRSEVDGERKFEITDVPACHWYGTIDTPL